MEYSKDLYVNREENLNRWIKEYSNAILQTCIYLMPDRSLAEVAVQETLIKAWRYLGKGNSKRILNERAWLLRIASNTCKDYLRKGWMRFENNGIQEEELPTKVLHIDPDCQHVTLMVMDLPEKYRQILLLYYFQGMNQKEIADYLGASEATICRRMRRAVSMLSNDFESG